MTASVTRLLRHLDALDVAIDIDLMRRRQEAVDRVRFLIELYDIPASDLAASRKRDRRSGTRRRAGGNHAP